MPINLLLSRKEENDALYYNECMKKHRSAFIFIFTLLIVFASFSAFSSAEDGLSVITTWTAENLYPSDYRGRALPSTESLVVVSATTLQNQKLIDSSLIRFKWYLDGKFYKEGDGLREISFYTTNRAGDSHTVRVLASLAGNSTSKTIEIPISEKELVIESSVGASAPSNSSVVFTATPYFFNVQSISDLDISWKIQKRDIPGEKKNTLFVQFGTPENSGQGAVTISSLAKEKESVFQKAASEFLISIGR